MSPSRRRKKQTKFWQTDVRTTRSVEDGAIRGLWARNLKGTIVHLETLILFISDKALNGLIRLRALISDLPRKYKLSYLTKIQQTYHKMSLKPGWARTEALIVRTEIDSTAPGALMRTKTDQDMKILKKTGRTDATYSEPKTISEKCQPVQYYCVVLTLTLKPITQYNL